MKVISSCFILLSSLFIISCSDPQAVSDTVQSTNTVKSVIRDKESQFLWKSDEPFESNNHGIIELSLEESLVQLDNNTIWPVLEGLGTISYEGFSPKQKNTTIQFCQKLAENIDSTSSFFDSRYIFNYVLFKHDFEEFYPELFSKDEKSNIFEKWTIVKPFISDDMIKVPVRFSNRDISVDLILFMNPESCKLYDINIDNRSN